MSLAAALLVFVVTAVVVVVAAIALAYSSDILADRIGWGSLWVGAVLVAGVTSLPETVTAATAAHIGVPSLAAGDVLGANMMNMANLTWLAAIFGGAGVYNRIGRHQIQGAVLALALTGSVTLFAALQWHTKWWIVSPAALVLFVIYGIGSRFLFKSSQAQQQSEPSGVESSQTTRWAWTVFLIAAAVILVSTPLLATASHDIASSTGIADSFFGVLAVAFITTMPEVTASATALRLNSPDLAFGNMYGSNAFNIMALAIADFFYGKGSLFGALDKSHVIAGLFALLLMCGGIGLLFLRDRSKSRISVTRLAAPVFIAIYVAGLYLVYQAGS